MMRYFSYLVVATMILGVALTSCKDNEDVPREFTVSFETGDDGSAVAPQKVLEREKVSKPEDSPTRSGYEFVAWYKEVELIREWNFETDVVIADVTLYAKWEQKKYSVIVTCEGDGTARANVISALEGELITLTATANDGHRFAEWQVIKGGIALSSRVYNPEFFEMPDRDVEVKAIFVPFIGLLESSDLSFDYSESGIMYLYTYDSQNRLTRSIDGKGMPYNQYIDYIVSGDLTEYYASYTGPGRMPGSRTTFAKNGNKITFITSNRYYMGHRNDSVYGKLVLNACGLPVKLTSKYFERYTNGANYWVHTTVTLTWKNGNLTKTDWEREDENGSSAGTVVYSHDDKKSTFYHCKTPKWVLWWLNYCTWNGYNVNYEGTDNYWGKNYGYNKNNIKTETWEGGSIVYEYTYNVDGFPLSRIWTAETRTYAEEYKYE